MSARVPPLKSVLPRELLHASTLRSIPRDPEHLRQLALGLGVSAGLHLFILGGIAFALLGAGRSFLILPEKNAALFATGPAGEKQVRLVLQTAPPVPDSVGVPVAEKKPVGQKKETSPATEPSHPASGPAQAFSKLVIGSEHFPAPQYPAEARNLGEAGTVTLHLAFDATGSVAQAEIVQSSGYTSLDVNARSFILHRWHDVRYAGQTLTVPIVYALTDN